MSNKEKSEDTKKKEEDINVLRKKAVSFSPRLLKRSRENEAYLKEKKELKRKKTERFKKINEIRKTIEDLNSQQKTSVVLSEDEIDRDAKMYLRFKNISVEKMLPKKVGCFVKNKKKMYIISWDNISEDDSEIFDVDEEEIEIEN